MSALHLCGRNSKNLESVATRCRKIAQIAASQDRLDSKVLKVTTSFGDVGVAQDVRRICNEFRCAHGNGVEILVANAGLNRVGAIEDISNRDFDLVMNTNLKGR